MLLSRSGSENHDVLWDAFEPGCGVVLPDQRSADGAQGRCRAARGPGLVAGRHGIDLAELSFARARA